MADKRYSGSLALTKLKHVVMEGKGKDGAVKGLFIPLAANLLTIDDNGNVYMPVSVVTKEEQDQYKQNGFISKSLDTKQYKDATPEQREEWKPLLPILGSIKDFSGGTANDNSGQAGEPSKVYDPEKDDLPF